jgi:radical SAM protein (TIGR01212 family)
VAAKTGDGRYVAYFQAFTSTYAPTERLRELFEAAIEPDYIVGLSVGTRPDCLPPETVELLGRLNRIKPVTVELGLQTSDDEVARYINRGYPSVVYRDAVARLKEAGCEVVTHIIIGLPDDDARETTRFAVDCGTDGVKFHLLHVLRNTRLEQEYLAGRINALSMEEYAERLKSCIDLLPPHVVVHRITGDGAKRELIAPMWSADKKRVLNYLTKYLRD